MLNNAKYIWRAGEREKNSYVEFFDTLSYQNGEVSIDISVDGDYTLYVNGKYASSSQYGDFEHYKAYDTVDITPYLVQGENAIAILAWYFGEDLQRYKKYSPGLIFEIKQGDNVLLASSERTLCRKSPTYKSGQSKKISGQLGFSFSYDATAEDAFPNEKCGFENALAVEKNSIFVKRPIKKHSLLPSVQGKIVSQSEDGTNFLLDLGKETVGFLSFCIEAATTADITVAYSEHLVDGSVPRIIGGRDFSVEYRAKAGKNSFTNYMLRLACRYLHISSSAPIKCHSVSIIPQSYEPKRLQCPLPDGLDARIYEICVNTLDACMMEHYVDCPWREQCLYAFDSRNQMLAGYIAYADKNAEYARSNLKLISMDRRSDGLLSICYPSGIDLTIPSFSLHYITAVCEYLEATGDTSLVYEVDFKLKEIISTFLANEKNGVIYAFEGENHWGFYDWSPYQEGNLWGEQKKSAELTLTLLLIYALECYKKISDICALPFEYGDAIQRLKNGVVSTFYNQISGLFSLKSDSELYHTLPNSLAVILKLLDDDGCAKIAEKIAQGCLIEPSLSMKTFKYDALLSVDGTYVTQIKDEIRKIYAKMLDQGSSTVWETEEGASAFDNAGSLCHGWSAIAIKYLLM